MIALVEFAATENYTEESKHSIFAWFIFIFATCFTQVIILNMLIAIMGDTFDNVFENKKQAILKLKVQVMADFSFFIKTDKDANKFLFVATQKVQEDADDEEWGGKITAIRRMIESHLKEQKEMVEKKIA